MVSNLKFDVLSMIYRNMFPAYEQATEKAPSA